MKKEYKLVQSCARLRSDVSTENFDMTRHGLRVSLVWFVRRFGMVSLLKYDILIYQVCFDSAFWMPKK